MRELWSAWLFAAAVVAAGAAPLVPRADADAARSAHVFPGWPRAYEGRDLSMLPLSAREAGFARDFPGRIARFSDGRREIIIRWVDTATRKLHPAADCFRGIGFEVTPGPLRHDVSGRPMGCFRATRGSEALRVCEGLHSVSGDAWPDVSQWYWTAMFAGGSGPWWSYVVAEVDASSASAP